MRMPYVKTMKAGYREVKRVIRHGLAYPWRRYVVSREVFYTDAIHTNTSGDVTVCVLTSSKDWLTCLWSLVSFYRFSGLKLPLLVYSDGTLRESHAQELTKVFPNARFIGSTEGASLVAEELSNYPNCLQFSGLSPYARKIIDLPVLCKSKSMLLLDSDILFFRPPDELVKYLNGDRSKHFVFESDYQDSYFDSRENIQKIFNAEIASRVNSGIVIADIERFDYARLEGWLGNRLFQQEHHWAEQTLWAMYAGEEQTILLSERYDVTMSADIGPDTVMKHYVKPIRDFLYTDGLPRLREKLEERGVRGIAESWAN
jgi:hypothetical protein